MKISFAMSVRARRKVLGLNNIFIYCEIKNIQLFWLYFNCKDDETIKDTSQKIIKKERKETLHNS